MLYLTAAAWDEAIKKEQSRIKVIEDRYNAKILENGVSENHRFIYFINADQYTIV